MCDGSGSGVCRGCVYGSGREMEGNSAAEAHDLHVDIAAGAPQRVAVYHRYIAALLRTGTAA